MKYPALLDGASWFNDKILFRSKYMNILTPYSFAEKQRFSEHAKEYISIELVSPSVNSGTSSDTKPLAL